MTYETVTDRVVANIRKHRAARGWTMAELAARSGLSENVLANIESGRRDEQGRRRRRITAEEIEAIEIALFGHPPSGILFMDPNWEEKGIEQIQAERDRTLKDLKVARAYTAMLVSGEMLAEVQQAWDEMARRYGA